MHMYIEMLLFFSLTLNAGSSEYLTTSKVRLHGLQSRCIDTVECLGLK